MSSFVFDLFMIEIIQKVNSEINKMSFSAALHNSLDLTEYRSFCSSTQFAWTSLSTSSEVLSHKQAQAINQGSFWCICSWLFFYA